MCILPMSVSFVTDADVKGVYYSSLAGVYGQYRQCQCWTCLSQSEVGQCRCRNTTCQCASACSAHSSHCSHTVRQALTSAAATIHRSSPQTTRNCRHAQSPNDPTSQPCLSWLTRPLSTRCHSVTMTTWLGHSVCSIVRKQHSWAQVATKQRAYLWCCYLPKMTPINF